MGGDLIALKMSEAILAQAIRSFIESREAENWDLGAFANKNISRALQAFHKAPAERWTVDTLAQAAGMSRTSFAVQFQKMMVMTPMDYVAKWRMEIAKKVLQHPGASLISAAENAGYASESLFTRVFKRETGVTPAQFRRARMTFSVPI